MSKIISILLFLSLFSTTIEASTHRDIYLVDQTFCKARAMLGKASADARKRGTLKEKWEYQLDMMRKDPKSSEFLYVGSHMALMDLNTIYSADINRDTKLLYLDLFNDCMVFYGRTIKLPTGSQIYSYLK